MKFVLTMILSLAGAQAFAETITCTNGTIDKMGDTFFQIDILEDGITLLPYESSLTVDAADVVNVGNTYAILDKKLTGASEGEELEQVVDAILTLSTTNKLNVAISYDKGPFTSYEMTCEIKN